MFLTEEIINFIPKWTVSTSTAGAQDFRNVKYVRSLSKKWFTNVEDTLTKLGSYI